MKTVLFFLLFFVSRAYATDPKEMCIYKGDDGTVKQVNSRAKVPVSKRDSAKCIPTKQSSFLAKPDEIKLKGAIRKDRIISPLGTVELRWPRKAEVLFGRTPQRAMVDAARAVSRAIKSPGFPAGLRRLDVNWKVVFLDADVRGIQIPTFLIQTCHPGWMTPPGNIYIVSQRVAGGCFGKTSKRKVADSELAEVLIHEIGHAVEFALLGDRFGGDRMRAEGFATWFESFASDYSSVIRRGHAKAKHFAIAREWYKRSNGPFTFSGTAYDYARASLYFHAVTKRRGVRGLMQTYELMLKDRIGLVPAIQKRTGWSDKRLAKEMQKLVF